MVPEFHPGTSDVEVCESRSPFVHVTVVPTSTLRSGGAKALPPRNSAPTGIVIDDEGPAGEGAAEGVGDVGEDESPLPQAAANNRTTEMRAKRTDDIEILLVWNE